MAEMKQAIRAVGYIRCSTEDQSDSGLGLDAQRERIERYAALRGIEVVEYISDAAVSGGTLLAEREGGRRMLAMLAGKRRSDRTADAVIVLKLDRGWRDAVDCVQTVREWSRRGVELHVIDMGGNAINASTAFGFLVLWQFAGLGEFERLQIAERTSSALTTAKARGKRVSYVATYGYRIVQDGVDDDGNPVMVQVADDSEQSVIRRIVELAGKRHTVGMIRRQLTRDGVRNREGNELSAKVVRRVLERARSD